MPIDIKRTARFALFGAVGFTVGGILGLLIGDASPIDFYGTYISSSYSLIPPATGLIGGAMLGAALGKWSKVIVLGLLGAIGFTVGAYIPLESMFSASSWFSWGDTIASTVNMAFIMMGAVGGAAIGLGLLRWKIVLGLAFAGALGGVIGGWMFLYSTDDLSITLPFTILADIIGGALLGAALGFLERGMIEE